MWCRPSSLTSFAILRHFSCQFFNAPCRKKKSKSEEGETGHSPSTIKRPAECNPDEKKKKNYAAGCNQDAIPPPQFVTENQIDFQTGSKNSVVEGLGVRKGLLGFVWFWCLLCARFRKGLVEADRRPGLDFQGDLPRERWPRRLRFGAIRGCSRRRRRRSVRYGRR